MNTPNSTIILDPTVYNGIISELLEHRAKIDMRLNAIAQDLARRGRVHDNSVSDDTEVLLRYNAITAKTKDKSDNYMDLANGLHESNNDHHAKHFEAGLNGMSTIQFTEFLVDHMVKIENTHDTSSWIAEDYIKHIPELSLPDYSHLRCLADNTITHIRKLTTQREHWVSAFKEEVCKDAENKGPSVQTI